MANFHIKISHQLSYGTVHVCSRNGRLVATMSFEKGDVSSSPTDDAAPEGEPAPDAAPLPPPPVPAFLEGVSAPTEPVAPNTVAAPSAVEELSGRRAAAAGRRAAAAAARGREAAAGLRPAGAVEPGAAAAPGLRYRGVAARRHAATSVAAAGPGRDPGVAPAGAGGAQPAVTVPRALRELAAHNTPATTTALMAAAAPPPPPPVTGLRFKGGVSSETAAALARGRGAAARPPRRPRGRPGLPARRRRRTASATW